VIAERETVSIRAQRIRLHGGMRVTQTDRLTPEAFAARIRALGFDPPQATLDEMYAALPHLDAMRARLRRAYTYADEPAHVYAMRGEAR